MIEVFDQIARLPLQVIVTLTLPAYLLGVGTHTTAKSLAKAAVRYARSHGSRNPE